MSDWFRVFDIFVSFFGLPSAEAPASVIGEAQTADSIDGEVDESPASHPAQRINRASDRRAARRAIRIQASLLMKDCASSSDHRRSVESNHACPKLTAQRMRPDVGSVTNMRSVRVRPRPAEVMPVPN
jgi:hypothetical protein